MLWHPGGIILLLFLLYVLMAVGCYDWRGGQTATNTTPEEPIKYTIRYSDDTGTKSIEVTDGEFYAITDLPSREGYRFTGLWSQKTGGTQYVDENGSALSPFTDKTSLVLYPQFEPIRYTILLDYGDANPNGNPSTLTVNYGEKLPELPTNLQLEHMEFVGWFTEPNRGGEAITNSFGVLADKAFLISDAYQLSDPAHRIRLYAGFRGEACTLTLWLDTAKGISEQVVVERGTPASAVRAEMRIDGRTVLSWSCVADDTSRRYLFNGTVRDNMTLYAAEWAPVIDFETEGGTSVASIVAQWGSIVTLPTPEREHFRFAYWRMSTGEKYSSEIKMPSYGAKFYAHWLPVLTFESNGGSEVTEISGEAGSMIRLPGSTRSGYEFAGWYTEDKKLYTSSVMPEVGMTLQAGWLLLKSNRVDLPGAGESVCIDTRSTPSERSNLSTKIDLSAYRECLLPVVLSIHYRARWKIANPSNAQIGVFLCASDRISASELLVEDLHTQSTTREVPYSFTAETEVNTDTYLLCWVDRNGKDFSYISDVWVEIRYVDTSAVLFS